MGAGRAAVGTTLVQDSLQSQASSNCPSPDRFRTNNSQMSASPSSHRSTSLRSRHRTDSPESVAKEGRDSGGVGDREGKQGGRLQRMTWRGKGDGNKERAAANSKQYTRMGLVMESPEEPPQQLPWAMGSLNLASTAGSSRSKGNGEIGQVNTHTTTGMLRSSPPIAVEGVENGRRSPRGGVPDPGDGDMEGIFSSPDSGYGNTPDQQAAAVHNLGRTQPQAILPPKRSRSGAITGPPDSDEGSGGRVSLQSEGLRGNEVASGDSLSTSELFFRRESQSRGRRQRENTQDSALFMDCSASHEANSRDLLQQQFGEDSIFSVNGGPDSSGGSAGHRRMNGRRQAHTAGGRLNTYSVPSPTSGVTRAAMSSHLSSRPASTSGTSASLSYSQSKKKQKSLYHRGFTKSSSGGQ